MTITARHVRATADAYVSVHPGDKASLAPLYAVLDAAGDGIASREEFRGHATAGVVLLRADGRVLLIEHLALKKWLLPGGHLETEDTTLHEAALRELSEETGIDSTRVEPVGDGPVHIDVHPIPANDAKGEAAHQHFDFRYLFRTDAENVRLQEGEVTGFAWQSADLLPEGPLRERVLGATTV